MLPSLSASPFVSRLACICYSLHVAKGPPNLGRHPDTDSYVKDVKTALRSFLVNDQSGLCGTNMKPRHVAATHAMRAQLLHAFTAD